MAISRRRLPPSLDAGMLVAISLILGLAALIAFVILARTLLAARDPDHARHD